MPTQNDLPRWVWDLVIAMLNHEDEHSEDAQCLDAILRAVPADVRGQADAIRGYVRSAAQGVVKDHAEKSWASLMKAFDVLHPPSTPAP